MLIRKRGWRASPGFTLGATTTGLSRPKHSVRRLRANESAMPAANLLTVFSVAGATRMRSVGGQGGVGLVKFRRTEYSVSSETAGTSSNSGLCGVAVTQTVQPAERARRRKEAR